MKKLFFVLFVFTFIFPLTGMDMQNEDIVAPATPAPPRKVSAATLQLHTSALSNLLDMSIQQIHNVHGIFSGEYTKDNQPEIQIAQIKVLFNSLLENVFVPYFKAPRTKHFTPDCKKSLGSLLQDIAGDSPGTFTRKGTADFLQSTDLDRFYTFITNAQNTFFIQKILIDPAAGFALFRRYTNTLLGPSYGKYNVIKLLDARSPETHSGTVELHHVYQNQEVITIVPYSEHKGNPKAYHKSSKDSKIDRAICLQEFYYIKKLIGLLQVAQMCTQVLYDCPALPSDITGNLQYMENYEGNICILPNSNAAREIKQKYTVQEAFAHKEQLVEQFPDEAELSDDEDVDTVVAPFVTRRDSWDSGYTDSDNSSSSSASSLEDEIDGEKNLIAYQSSNTGKKRGSTSFSLKSPLSPIRDNKRTDIKKTPTRAGGKENSDNNTNIDDFTKMFLRESQRKTDDL